MLYAHHSLGSEKDKLANLRIEKTIQVRGAAVFPMYLPQLIDPHILNPELEMTGPSHLEPNLAPYILFTPMRDLAT